MNEVKKDIKAELSQLNDLLNKILEDKDEDDLNIVEIRLRRVIKLVEDLYKKDRFAYYVTEALSYGFEPVKLG